MQPSSGSLPGLEFMVAGFSKCGTTTLCSLLADHPQLHLPASKDMRLFHLGDHDARYPQLASLLNQASPGQQRGLGSVWMSDHEFEVECRRRLLNDYPHIRLIFIARDPVDRIESTFRERHHNKADVPGSFPFDLAGALTQAPAMIRDSLYSQRYANYAEHMQKDRLLVVLLEQLIADPQRVLDRCSQFLGVGPAAVHAGERKLNAGSTKYQDTQALRSMRQRPEIDASLYRIPKDIRHALLPKLGLRRPFSGEPLSWSAEAIDAVKRQLVPDARTFLQMLGEPLQVWPRLAAMSFSSHT